MKSISEKQRKKIEGMAEGAEWGELREYILTLMNEEEAEDILTGIEHLQIIDGALGKNYDDTETAVALFLDRYIFFLENALCLDRTFMQFLNAERDNCISYLCDAISEVCKVIE